MHTRLLKQFVFMTVLTLLPLLLLQKEGLVSTYGGVEYFGTYVKVWNVISTGHTRDGGAELDEVERREKESKPGLDALGKELDGYIQELVSAKSSYPWARQLLKKYPKNEEGKGRRLYFGLDEFRLEETTYVGVWSKSENPWLPINTYMKALVKQWMWKEKKLNLGTDNPKRVKYLFEKFDKNDDMWGTSAFIDTKVKGEYVDKLKGYLASDKEYKRFVAMNALATGGYITEPEFFVPYLTDQDKRVRNFAVQGLFLIPNKAGEVVLKANIDKIIDLFEDDEAKDLRKYLDLK
jgi:hypothetical protein